MDSLKELTYYCNIDKPVGALLLSGEWGCGKTYIVEHNLRERLKESCVIVRVSLFGIQSIEAFHKEIKTSWLHAKSGLLDKIKGAKKFKDVSENLIKLIPDEQVQLILKSLSSLNFIDYMKISNQIEKKKVILVLDDLERSKMQIIEVLGAINEYCENRGFNVIIIADESKLKSDHDYKDFKEKVIQRTVHYKPDYEAITNSIILDIQKEEYKEFLETNIKEITALFAGTDSEGNSLDIKSSQEIYNASSFHKKDADHFKENKYQMLTKRPHNIRSLKCAIQDFERIFEILIDKKINDCEKWLFSFLTFSLAFRANLLQDYNEFTSLFVKQDVNILYPGFFDARYLPSCLVRWISKGQWDEEELYSFIDQNYLIGDRALPKERIKNMRIDYFDEQTAREGLKNIIPDVYNGLLTLDQYVMFIINSKLAREYELIELEIDWEKVRTGINKRIESNIANKIADNTSRNIISNLDDYSEEEKRTYQIIEEERSNRKSVYEINRQEYIDIVRKDPQNVFTKTSDTEYRCFDEEMALATFEGYKTLDGYSMANFANYFEGKWIRHMNSLNIRKEEKESSVRSFLLLKDRLSILAEGYKDYPFKKRFTEAFITKIEELVKDD